MRTNQVSVLHLSELLFCMFCQILSWLRTGWLVTQAVSLLRFAPDKKVGVLRPPGLVSSVKWWRTHVDLWYPDIDVIFDADKCNPLTNPPPSKSIWWCSSSPRWITKRVLNVLRMAGWNHSPEVVTKHFWRTMKHKHFVPCIGIFFPNSASYWGLQPR